jgi:glycine cleavage system regulatory protein
MASLVLTAIGDDRAGLVSALADVVAAHDGNWERSQMAELAGKFAGIVLVTVPDSRVDELTAALAPLAGVLDVGVHIGGGEITDAQHFSLHLLGNDRPGIVRELSTVLANHGVNIDELSTETWEAPMAGGVLFEADAVLEAPADLEEGTLRAALEAVANELMVEIELER